MKRTLIALALATAIFAGCGGDDEEQSAATPEATQEPASGGGGGQTVDVSAPADGSLKFDQSELSAKAGKVTFKFANPSSVPHAFEVEGNGVEDETDVVTKSDASVTVDLKPGTYEYYCPVGQHEQAGMKGTLTVE
jgi:plastocyanin